MNRIVSALRVAAIAALLGGAASSGVVGANIVAPSPYVKSAMVQVDVYDRFDRSALPVFSKDGRNYIVGAPGHEYAVRIRNCTGGRVLVVTSVDGVNVVSGETASPAQSGYVLEPWGSVEIVGWRKSMDRTAAFYFTDLGDSYAARTGRPRNVGVIGVAVFPEKPQRIAWRGDKLMRDQAPFESDASGATGATAKSEARAEAQSAAPAASPPAQSMHERAATDELASEAKKENSARLLGKLGTGHGRNEDSRVSLVNFERASTNPADTVTVQYDRRENLVAMGVLPEPRPYYAQREPNPFPGAIRFAPDPNR